MSFILFSKLFRFGFGNEFLDKKFLNEVGFMQHLRFAALRTLSMFDRLPKSAHTSDTSVLGRRSQTFYSVKLMAIFR